MAGICGVLGHPDVDIDWMAHDLQWTGEETTASYTGEDVAIRSVFHPGADREQPAATSDDALVWVWGDVWGYEGSDGYVSRRRDDGGTIAAFCAERYEEHGTDFAAGLNGNFAAVVHDRDDGAVHLITDRLGTHPVYYARQTDGSVVFSAQIQSLPLHSGVDTTFDVQYLSEYFTLGAVGGVKTPLTGIENLPPSSVTTVDLDAETAESERYWQPNYEPLDEPFSHFVDRFEETFEAVLADRIDPDSTYGLLLSGGSDSRAILAGVDQDVDLRTYHAAGWSSREARTAKRVAEAADREFRVLERDRDSHERMLETTPRMMNFQGRFNEAHISEFADQLREEVDVLISGHGADTLFRDHAFPRPTIGLGPLGKFTLPVVKETPDVDEFVSRRDEGTPPYLDAPSSPGETLENNIDTTGDVTHHGVDYRSIDELVFFDDFYPLTNKSDFFYSALNDMMPHWSPFFDNRLVDLALQLPVEYRTRRNVINEATVELDDTLGSIPHGETGVPLTRSFPVDYVWGLANQFVWKHLSPDRPPEAHLTHGPWTNKRQLLREHEFVDEALREKEELIDSLGFLDREGVVECYRDHLNGADNTYELYTLLSFLHMPVVERMATTERRKRRQTA